LLSAFAVESNGLLLNKSNRKSNSSGIKVKGRSWVTRVLTADLQPSRNQIGIDCPKARCAEDKIERHVSKLLNLIDDRRIQQSDARLRNVGVSKSRPSLQKCTPTVRRPMPVDHDGVGAGHCGKDHFYGRLDQLSNDVATTVPKALFESKPVPVGKDQAEAPGAVSADQQERSLHFFLFRLAESRTTSSISVPM